MTAELVGRELVDPKWVSNKFHAEHLVESSSARVRFVFHVMMSSDRMNGQRCYCACDQLRWRWHWSV